MAPITNSCPWFRRIFIQAPERCPDSYVLFVRLATSPSSPCSFTDATSVPSGAYRETGIPDRVGELGHNARGEDLLPDRELLVHQVFAADHQDVEHVVEDGARAIP